MSAIFRIRLLARTGTHLWCAVSGHLTARTTDVLRDQLTDRCAGATVVVLDLRDLGTPGEGAALSAPWPERPHTIHLLAPESLRARVTADARAHWHSTVDTAWQAWCR
ncbi:hypothetical protein ACWD1Z_33310 [Streptomyces sp. NPDC002784]